METWYWWLIGGLVAVIGWMLRAYHVRLEQHLKRSHKLANQLMHVWLVVRTLWRDRYGHGSEPPRFPDEDDDRQE